MFCIGGPKNLVNPRRTAHAEPRLPPARLRVRTCIYVERAHKSGRWWRGSVRPQAWTIRYERTTEKGGPGPRSPPPCSYAPDCLITMHCMHNANGFLYLCACVIISARCAKSGHATGRGGRAFSSLWHGVMALVSYLSVDVGVRKPLCLPSRYCYMSAY